MTWPVRILVGAALLIAGMAFGRWATPPRVEVREKVRTVEVERKVHVASVEAERKTDDRKVVRRVIRVVVQPDGTRIEDRDEREASATLTDDRRAEVQVRTEYRDRTVEVEKLRIVENRPDWLVSARAGVDIGDRSMVYGGELGRRIVGGLYLTASGDSRGAVMGGITWTW